MKESIHSNPGNGREKKAKYKDCLVVYPLVSEEDNDKARQGTTAKDTTTTVYIRCDGIPPFVVIKL
jgi:hypothetical protein